MYNNPNNIFGGPSQQNQGGFGQQGGFGGPQQGNFGGPQQQGGFGGPSQQQGGFGSPQQQGGFGRPPQQQGGFGGPQQQQGGFGLQRPVQQQQGSASIMALGKATDPRLRCPNEQYNMEVVSALLRNPNEIKPTLQVIRALIKNDNDVLSWLGINVLEIIIKKVKDSHTLIEEKHFWDALVKVARNKRFKHFFSGNKLEGLKLEVQQKALFLISLLAFTHQNRRFPIFNQTFLELGDKGFIFPGLEHIETKDVIEPFTWKHQNMLQNQQNQIGPYGQQQPQGGQFGQPPQGQYMQPQFGQQPPQGQYMQPQ